MPKMHQNTFGGLALPVPAEGSLSAPSDPIIEGPTFNGREEEKGRKREGRGRERKGREGRGKEVQGRGRKGGERKGGEREGKERKGCGPLTWIWIC